MIWLHSKQAGTLVDLDRIEYIRVGGIVMRDTPGEEERFTLGVYAYTSGNQVTLCWDIDRDIADKLLLSIAKEYSEHNWQEHSVICIEDLLGGSL